MKNLEKEFNRLVNEKYVYNLAIKVGIGDIVGTSAEKGAGKQEVFALIEKAIEVNKPEE